MFESLQSDVLALRAKIQECLELLDTMEQASFGFQAGEAGIAAIKAQWITDGRKEGPRGVFFLTDRRLIFEQREKVVKKRFLFVATESEQVQELQWEAPVGAVVAVEASEQRRALVLKKEQLTLEFKHPSPVREVLLQLQGDSEEWEQLINRARSGEIERERIPSQGRGMPLETPKVPTKCPSCGAALDITTLRGMTTVTCRYCGSVIPLGE